MWKDEVPEKDGEDGEKIDAIPGEWETVNKATALWTRDKSEVTEEEYKEMLDKMPARIDWSTLSDYEQEDNTAAMQTLACSGDSCEIVDLT